VTAEAAETAAHAVTSLGGTVTEQLPIISGFAATLPAAAVPALATVPGVREITLDGVMHVQADAATPEPDSATAAPAPAAPAADPATTTAPDPNSLPSVYRTVLGSDDLAARGADGSGVTVALVDTGVSSMPDLAGRIVPVTTGAVGGTPASCVNFSGDSTCDDQYGHGTFLAGLIAGNGTSSDGAYRGTAPGAKVLSLKLSGPDGSADVSKVLAAIQWVVSFRQQYGIRVLNLSLGTDSTQSYRVDPLNYAVEQAWKSGIVVAVAASNRGPGSSTISKPGDDPYVLTVGAIDDSGTVATDDDVLPDFSSRGPTAADGLAKPDVVAPGSHLVSLAAPGSTISTTFPSTMPAPYRRGSGTSMATAAVSGLIASLLDADPTMTPDRVKYALMSTARPDAVADRQAVGAGLVNGAAALGAGPGLANQGLTPSDGRGSLSLSRGHLKVKLAGGTILDGENTAQARAWLLELPNYLIAGTTGSSWSGSSWSGSSWSSGAWLGASWSGSSWSGSSWSGSSWSGSSWSGSSWSGSSWSGSRWYGSSWSGSQWYGAWDR
jgi:serine protease AprX